MLRRFAPGHPGPVQLNESRVVFVKNCDVPPAYPYRASLTMFLPNVDRKAADHEYRWDHWPPKFENPGNLGFGGVQDVRVRLEPVVAGRARRAGGSA